MSANNQILVKEHKGRFYVFDVMAETWGEWKNDKPVSKKNYLSLERALKSFDTYEEAHEYAHYYDDTDDIYPAEYGVVDEVLYKDNAPVIIVETAPKPTTNNTGRV